LRGDSRPTPQLHGRRPAKRVLAIDAIAGPATVTVDSPAGYTQEALTRATEHVRAKDMAAFVAMVKADEAVFVNAGQSVTVLDRDLLDGMLQVRHPGMSRYLWMWEFSFR
jgi:hypothetical protein